MYSLNKFCEILNGTLFSRGNEKNISTINIYPLEMISGDAFFVINSKKYTTTDGGFGNTGNEDSVFGLKGTQDTSSFVPSAISLGSSTIVFDNIESIPYFDPQINYIFVEDTIHALALLAKEILKKSKARIIGITGSTGKTTLSKYLANYIGLHEKVFILDCIRITYLGLIWSVIHEFDDTYDWIVLEMQTDGIGQLDRICKIANLDYAFILNVGDSHLERFGSKEKLLNEKLSLYRGLSPNGKLIINRDDSNLENWTLKRNDSRIVSIGRNLESDFVLQYDETIRENSLSIINNFNHSNHSFDVKLYGDRELYCEGMLYAFSYLAYDIDDFLIDDQICFFESVGRFQEFVGRNKSKIIVDSYNASYASVVYGVKRISNLKMENKILVLGSLLELYDRAETVHKELGKFLNTINVFDYILFIGEATLYTMNELRDNPKVKTDHVYSYERAMTFLKAIALDENTVIYFKGSGAMRLELLAMNFI